MTLVGGYKFRALEVEDYQSYLDTLKVLTTVGEIPEVKFVDLVHHWKSLPDIYKPHVIVNEAGTVVATGMLLVERKLIHECGLVGHIEDISVAKSEQGKQLGKAMITKLTDLAKQSGCYKVILDCSPKNIPFYEKCGYKNDGIEMSYRF